MNRPQVLLVAIGIAMVSPVCAANLYWDPGSPATSPASGGSGTWIEGGNNWRSGATGGSQSTWTNPDDAIFLNTGGTVTLGSAIDIDSIVFNSGAGNFIFDPGGFSITMGGTLTNNSSNLQTFNANLILDGNRTINAASGNVYVAGNISQIGGNQNLTKSGNQTLILSGNNSYAGTTNINAGVLNIRSDTALGATSGNTTLSSGAALELQGDIDVGIGEDIQLEGTGISADGALRNISGNNSWAGGIELQNSASHRIHSDGDLLTITGAITESGGTEKTLTFGGAGNITVSGNISGADDVALAKVGNGTLILSGANSYTQGTAINAGILQAGSTGALGSGGTVSFGGGTLRHTAANTTDYSGRFSTAAGQQYRVDTNGQNVTWSTALNSAGGTLTKTGDGTLAITTSGSYGGATNVAGGALAIGSGVSISTSLLTVAAGAGLTGSGMVNGDSVVSGTVNPGSATGTLTFNGDLVLMSSSILNWNLNPSDTTLGGVINDLGIVADDLTLDGALSLSGSFTGLSTGTTWTLFTYGGSITDNGLNVNSLPALDLGQSWVINSTGGSVTLAIIPEPHAAVLGLLGTACILRRRRAD